MLPKVKFKDPLKIGKDSFKKLKNFNKHEYIDKPKIEKEAVREVKLERNKKRKNKAKFLDVTLKIIILATPRETE